MSRMWEVYRRNWIFWTVVLYLLVLAIILTVNMVGDVINEPPTIVIREGGR